MKNLEQELLAKIEEALPSQMSGLLKERLKHLEEIEIEHDELLVEHAETKEQLEQQNIKVSALEKEIKIFDGQRSYLANKQDDLNKKQHVLEKHDYDLHKKEELLLLKEKHAQEKCDLMLELYKIPFANRQVRESVTTTTPKWREYVTTGSQYDSNTCKYEEYTIRDDEMVEVKTETTKEEK